MRFQTTEPQEETIILVPERDWLLYRGPDFEIKGKISNDVKTNSTPFNVDSHIILDRCGDHFMMSSV
jgi:hypothetical protein